jgi:hypothetical protein
MAEKDVVYALDLLHTVQIKREAIGFASFINKSYNQLPEKVKERLWHEYLNQNKDD